MDMIMQASTAWWIVAGILVAAELATGTFYLLMLALGCVAAALAAWLGLGLNAQIVTAALLGGASVALWHRLRDRRPTALPAAANPDVNIDIGQAVQVDTWAPDGSTSVKYRGTAWRARYAGAGTPASGRFVIRAIDGSCLVLDR